MSERQYAKPFSNTLKEIIAEKKITFRMLAEALDVSHTSLTGVFSGNVPPRLGLLTKIAIELDLSNEQIARLFKSAGYIAPDRELLLLLNDSLQEQKNRATDDQMESKLNLEDAYVSLRTSIDNSIIKLKKDEDKTQAPSDRGELIDELIIAFNQLNDSKISELTAPVQMPSRHRMKVKLIPITGLNALEEYRSDQNQFFSIAFMFLGAFLGMIISFLLQIDASAFKWPSNFIFIIGGVILIAGVVFAVQAFNFKKRAERKKEELNDYWDEDFIESHQE